MKWGKLVLPYIFRGVRAGQGSPPLWVGWPFECESTPVSGEGRPCYNITHRSVGWTGQPSIEGGLAL